MQIEIVYALPDKQTVYRVSLTPGATVAQAIQQTPLLLQHPALDLSELVVGIWGKKAVLSTVLQDNDRVEIYRPLQIDPKAARKLRVAKKNKMPNT